MRDNSAGIYIHVPYCRRKCIYCDFYSGGERIADWKLFAQALIQEAKSRTKEIEPYDISTLYIGGGTPSLMPGEDFGNIISSLKNIFRLNQLKEFTIEVNPEDVSLEKIKIWKENGVNRLSLGIQTLNDEELKKIGRNHKIQHIYEALNLLKEYFDNISVDVMFGLPDQTLDSYRKTLKEIISFRPTHISSYSLMYEEGTAMTRLLEENRIKPIDEEIWLEMFNLTKDFLQNAGYNQYEISNYSLKGFESIHNKSYWEGRPYLGLGPSAHSYDGNLVRRANPNDIKGYLRYFSETKNKDLPIFYTEERLTQKELMEEMIMTRLRTVKGLNVKEFAVIFGEKAQKNLLQKAAIYIDNKLMKEENNYISLTHAGFLIYNRIVSQLFM